MQVLGNNKRLFEPRTQITLLYIKAPSAVKRVPIDLQAGGLYESDRQQRT